MTRAMLKDKPEDAQPKPVVRPYTPTTQPGVRGHMDLVVKVGDWLLHVMINVHIT